MPLVSAIIPTIRRPDRLLRAIRSVQAQTWDEFEIVVVVDGPDEPTMQALAGLAEPRLRVIANPASVGAGEARNIGARAAAGVWLAFLDDDDEWLPDKLATQLDGVSADDNVLIASRCQVETPSATHVWPRRCYDGRETVDEYLFGRRALLRGEAYLATPTFILPAALFARSGGFGGTRQNEDTTLLLRVTRKCNGRVIMRPEVLAVIHADPHDSLGTNFDWRRSLDWLDASRNLMTPRGISGFALITLASQAARVNDRGAIFVLLRYALRYGKPTSLQLILFAGAWFARGRLRTALQRVASGLRGRR
jgi:glycosyltransferase involved in cell wall biosynthesis